MDKKQLLVLIILFSGLSLLVSIFLIAVFLVQRAKANRYLLESRIRQQEYEKALLIARVEVQEETRKTIGVELHDNIGQLLSLANITMASVNLSNVTDTGQRLIDARKLVKSSIQELRRLSKVLHGDFVLQEGLEEAIQNDVKWLQRTGSWEVTLAVSGESINAVNKEKDLFIFRIFQECVNNIVKHSSATAIAITIEYKLQYFLMRIADNGVGFDVTAVAERKTGIGLLNIDRRVQLMNGTVAISSQPGSGTTIDFSIPYP